MTTRNIILAILLVLAAGLSGCAAPQPYQGAGAATQPRTYHPAYVHPAHERVVYPAQHGPKGWVVNTSAALSAYAFNSGAAPGTHLAYVEPDGRWNIAGFVQANPPIIIGGVPSGPITRGYGAQARPISGMSPETARMLLDEFTRRENPCTAKERTTIVSIGAFIGGAAAAVLTGDLRWAAAGALIGAAGGNSEAAMSCQAYTDTRMSLMLVLDQYGCSGQVRKTNGVVTDDEICDFRRSYTPGHRPPQIADREVIRPAAVPVVRSAPPPPKPRPAPKPRVEPEEELPAK